MWIVFAGNYFVIPVSGAEVEVSRVAARILEELVKPLRELDITNSEFACLKTIVFFSPGQSVLWSPPATPLPLPLLISSHLSSVLRQRKRLSPGIFLFHSCSLLGLSLLSALCALSLAPCWFVLAWRTGFIVFWGETINIWARSWSWQGKVTGCWTLQPVGLRR